MKAGWEIKKLGELCQVKTGKKDVNQGNPDGEYPFFTCARDHTYSDSYSFEGEAILIAGNGDVGNTSYYNGKFEAYQRTYVLMGFDGVLPRYLFLILDGKLKASLYDKKLGNTMPYIKKGMLTDFPIPLPPIAEQQRIVTILDEAFAGIANASANAEKNLQNARELFESCLRATFDKWHANTNKVKLVTLCQPKTITYGVIKLGDHIPGGVPCLRTSNVRRLKIDTKEMKCISESLSKDYSRTVLQGGEVLVNVRGTLGGVAVAGKEMAGWNVSREVAVVPVDTGVVDPKYVAYWIATKESQDWLTGVLKGVAYTGINLSDLRELPIYVPSAEEQKSVVKRIDKLIHECRELEYVHQNKLDNLTELKQSILQKAFAGELH